ncbi:MAG: DUF4340 domain-containing protein [Defluviitaleaceae bacterium]|nr:DUF4340 domain-containing protein [Defluviitaleaceae bacterium]
MKTQKILTLVITVVLIASLAGVYFWAIGRDTVAPREDSAPSTLVRLYNREEHDVVEVIFYRDGRRTYARPFHDRFGILRWAYSDAADFDVQLHLSREKARPAWILAAVGIAHENSAELDLAEFGLAPPLITAEAVFDDGSRNTLHLGSRTTDLQFHFAMVEGDSAIYLLNAILGERLLFTVGDMLDLSLPRMPIHNAEYIRITARGAEPIILGLAGDSVSPLAGLLEEVGGEQLVMYAPLAGVPLSHSRFLELVFNPIEGLRLHELAEFFPENLQNFGLDEPVLEFVFRTADREVHLKFGDTFTRGGEEFIYVQDASRPHVFIAESRGIAAIADVTPIQIADRALALVPITDVERVTIAVESAELELVFNHIPGTFDIEPTLGGRPIDHLDARQIFRSIIGLRADADIAPLDLSDLSPELTITHFHHDGSTTELRFFNFNANFLAVSINNGEAIFVTNRLAVARILIAADESTE